VVVIRFQKNIVYAFLHRFEQRHHMRELQSPHCKMKRSAVIQMQLGYISKQENRLVGQKVDKWKSAVVET
jgi:hypothetical protein